MTINPPATVPTVRRSTALTPFGGRDEVRELKARLEFMALTLPGGARLGVKEITALAQASIAHGLSPFNGELWLIPGSGLMIGIKGLRKKAREQGDFAIEFRQIDSPEEKAALGIPATALAYEARLSESKRVLEYAAEFIKLMKAGVSEATAFRILGERPYTSGYGYYVQGERTKMTPVQVAHKRAEADAIKRAYDVPLGLNATADDNPAEFSGEWVEGTASVTAAPAESGDGESDGFDNPGSLRAAASDFVGAVLDDALTQAGIETPDKFAPASTTPAADYQPSSPIWLKWAELKAQAEAMKVAAPTLDAASSDAEVGAACNKLTKELKAARNKSKAALYGDAADGLPA